MGVDSNDEGRDHNKSRGNVSGSDQLLVASIFAQGNFVDVLNKLRGCFVHLARQGRHHGSEHGDHQ